ncbi:tetratricopeptide repeat protein [Lentilactobacillus sp. Marseille-Q4993]|uniref:tetratricopeptide repeat protein n=1 Tax=Lentilactobacillus sp. Marseille-Q4993 TaxID=3039492 RepID=UPI0024BC07E0|nr:tetratricopeptide repeat protein [Lentilactobacillus sp. Marseille-Q4993]
MDYSTQALDALERGQIDEFNKIFKAALKSDSDDMLYSLAEELYSLGFSENSKQIYEQLLKKYPDDDGLKINLAELAIDNDDDDKALNLLSEISSNSDEYVRSLLVSADLYQTQGMFEISDQKLIEAQFLAPEEDVIKFALAEFYFNTRSFRKAINIYLELIKEGTLEMSAVNLVERLGVSYAETGKFEQALGYLEQIKPINMSPDVRFELGFTYFSLGEYEKAITEFEELKETDSQYSSLYPYLADAHVELNQFDIALIAIQEGLAVDQYNEEMWRKASEIAAKTGNEELVGEYLQKAHETNPEDISIMSSLSDWYIVNGKHDENIELLKPIAEQSFEDAHLEYNLALSRKANGDIKGAATAFGAAERELGDDTNYLKDAIFFYRENGNRDKELELLNKYLNLLPDDFEMQNMYDEDSEGF